MVQFLKNNRKTAFFALVIALLSGIVTGFNIYTQLQWDRRVKTWDVIHAEVRYNRGNHIGYVYKTGGNEYLGKSVTYGFPLPTDRTKGTDILCIINPRAPGESAALIRAAGFVNHIRRFSPSLICIPLCLICLTVCFTVLFKKEPGSK